MKFEPGMICHTCAGREVEILKVDAPGNYPIIGMFTADGSASAWRTDGQWDDDPNDDYNLLLPKRTREVTVYVNVLKHEGIEWNTTHDSYAVAKYNTTVLDLRIEVLAVAVPVQFTVEW